MCNNKAGVNCELTSIGVEDTIPSFREALVANIITITIKNKQSALIWTFPAAGRRLGIAKNNCHFAALRAHARHMSVDVAECSER